MEIKYTIADLIQKLIIEEMKVNPIFRNEVEIANIKYNINKIIALSINKK